MLFSLCTGLVLLSGCGTTSSFPNGEAFSAPDVHIMPAIQGSNYGGHAPIVGAHIFLLQAGTGGYGSKVTSLLGSTSANSSYPTALDSTTGSPTNGMYYVTTDSTGQYDLTGDYTCTAGDPVYIYGSGGNPSTNPNSGYAVTITGASAAPDANGKLLVTFTTTGNQLLYQGETINFGSTQSPNSTPFSGFQGETGDVVSSINLTTSTFAIEKGASSSTVPYSSFTQTATQVTPVVNNPAIANMAVVGICPGKFTIAGIPNGSSTSTLSGIPSADIAKLAVGDVIDGPGIYAATVTAVNTSTNTVTLNLPDMGGDPAGPNYLYTVTTPTTTFNFGPSSTDPVNYVYMNEVSTVAAAYALAPFASTTANNDALHIGTSSTNLAGLQAAALLANDLYDITGHNVGTGNNGDSHIARSVTPGTAGGTVPQSLLDTLGNVLANCVDSANTYSAVTATSGTASAQCSGTSSSGLFYNARSDGTLTGTAPNDTATAAFNIAHYPGGAASNSSFATNLVNSLTGNVPFQPSLSSVHDFAVAITYQTPSSSISDIAVDLEGNVWTVGGAANEVVELTPQGSFATYAPPAGSYVGTNGSAGITIDTAGNVYAAATAGTIKFPSGSTTGTLIGGSNTANAAQMTVDGSGNLYIANGYTSSYTTYYVTSSLYKESTAGVAAGGNFPIGPGAPNATQNTVQSCIPGIEYLALDSSNNLWTVTPNNSLNPYATVCRFDSSGNLQYSFSVTPGSTTGLPHQIAVDNGNNAWFAEKDLSNVYKIASGSTTANSGTTTASGGSLSLPKGIAIDGANTVWVSNTGYSSGNLVHYSDAAAALNATYLGGSGYGGASYLYLAADQSGSVWAVDNSDGILVQYVGIGTPVAQPFSAARAGVGLGARP
jgi:hypothetical protein